MTFLSDLWAKVAFVAAFLGLLALAALKLIGIGRDKERYKAATDALNHAKEARDVEARVDGADAAERERLRNKWQRE